MPQAFDYIKMKEDHSVKEQEGMMRAGMRCSLPYMKLVAVNKMSSSLCNDVQSCSSPYLFPNASHKILSFSGQIERCIRICQHDEEVMQWEDNKIK